MLSVLLCGTSGPRTTARPPLSSSAHSGRRTRCPPGRGGSPSATGACTANYRTVNSWSGGYQGEVTVKAGNSAVNGWTVRWTLSSGQSISQLWNGTLSGNSSAVTVSNTSYNASIPASGTTTFGFLGNGAPSTGAVKK
ncbi:cellulose binding domain-containing protein [Nonomuraea sp. NPDC049695]|uniref:cellulose binding domain-containing protein n=1 Tax=Nonomuraea sp. NPDC049695 TaxID=3154734 RepID=UPI003412BFD6